RTGTVRTISSVTWPSPCWRPTATPRFKCAGRFAACGRSNRPCSSGKGSRRPGTPTETVPKPRWRRPWSRRSQRSYLSSRPIQRAPWCSITARRCAAFSRRPGWTAPPSRLADGRGLGGGPRIDPTERGREKRGFEEKQLGRLASCIDRGLDEVRAEQETIQGYVKDIEEVAATLDPGGGSCADRQEEFEKLIHRLEHAADPIHQTMAGVMLSFGSALFVGEGKCEHPK